MGKLKIQYVPRPPRHSEDLPDYVVEVYIHTSGKKIDVSIGRHGFVVCDPVIESIRARIRSIAEATIGQDRSLAERLGPSPVMSQDWREFLDGLLVKGDSWAFFVPLTGRERLN